MNEGSTSTHGCVNPELAPVRGSIDYHSLIGEARIHGSLYTSEQVFQDEMERIFRRGWVFVGHESEVPMSGDYVTRVLGRESVVMLRNKNNQIKVFSNRCTHRGNKLCPKQRGNARALTCDYHGWTFSLDGDLVGVPYPGGFTRRKEDLSLCSPARVDSYQGFVFASFNAQGCSLEAHLGEARALIDRLVRLSPVGRIRLDAGWVKQKFHANWKMLPENDTDGYHANFVHSSFLRVFRSQYDAIRNREEDRRSVVRDWGSGHVAIDAAPMYRQPLEWLGTTEDRAPEYVASMTEAYGAADARRMLTEGPPHSVIFPNLFLGEMNVVIFQPLSAGRSVQWHTPLLLEGAPDSFNARIIRQSEASMGPSAFLLADDAVISERQQIALQGESAWLDLSRGLNREYNDDRSLTSHISDETTNRGFWRHYLRVMAGA
jgi:phenylpropionate dioxygenase-like ring-hydroxylating dioxygenase large terminal subunit